MWRFNSFHFFLPDPTLLLYLWPPTFWSWRKPPSHSYLSFSLFSQGKKWQTEVAWAKIKGEGTLCIWKGPSVLFLFLFQVSTFFFPWSLWKFWISTRHAMKKRRKRRKKLVGRLFKVSRNICSEITTERKGKKAQRAVFFILGSKSGAKQKKWMSKQARPGEWREEIARDLLS